MTDKKPLSRADIIKLALLGTAFVVLSVTVFLVMLQQDQAGFDSQLRESRNKLEKLAEEDTAARCRASLAALETRLATEQEEAEKYAPGARSDANGQPDEVRALVYDKLRRQASETATEIRKLEDLCDGDN